MWGGDQDDFLEAMAEASGAVMDNFDGNMVFINVMNHLSVDCDCDSNPAAPTMDDVGILASTDPVALDKACVDLVYSAKDGQDLINRMESRNGAHILEYAKSIGIGSMEYRLEKIRDIDADITGISFDENTANISFQCTGNADMIVGLYDTENRLVSIKMSVINDGDTSKDFDFKEDLNRADTIKAFIWDLNTMKPIANAKSEKIADIY